MKRCGKSAPHVRQRTWQGKPHREQNRIGTTRAACRPGPTSARSSGLVARGGWQQPSQRNGRHVTALRWPYRTRLTGRLTPFPDGLRAKAAKKTSGFPHQKACRFSGFLAIWQRNINAICGLVDPSRIRCCGQSSVGQLIKMKRSVLSVITVPNVRGRKAAPVRPLCSVMMRTGSDHGGAA